MADILVTNVVSAQQTLFDGEQIVVTPGGALVTELASVTNLSLAGFGAGDVSVANSGTIVSATIAILLAGQGNAINNTGHIAASLDAIDLSVGSTPSQAGIINSGTIHGIGPNADAIVANGSGVRLDNTGEIIAPGYGVLIFDADSSVVGANQIVNAGTIIGSVAIASGGDIDFVGNSGLVTGGVTLGAGTDFITNRGTVEGGIDLGPDADTYRAGGEGVAAGTVDGDTGDDTLAGGHLADRMAGGFGADRVVGRDGEDTLSGDGGADEVRGGRGADSVDGGDGDDRLFGGTGSDTVTGGDGADEIWGGCGADTILGQTGADGINAGRGDDSVRGDNQDDTIRGQAGDDSLDGGSGSDVILGGHGADSIEGGIFDDLIGGGTGNDTVLGENGDDTLHGGAGDDVITLGDGADVVVFRKGYGQDLVTDFTDGQDRVDVRGLNLQNFGDLQTKYTVVAHQNAVFFDFGDGDTLMLDGVTLPQLAYGDFIWF